MLVAASLLLVAATVLVFALNIVLSSRGELVVGYAQIIHSGVPYLLLAPMAIGVGLAIVALVRRRTWTRAAVAGVEAVMLAFFVFLFVGMTELPGHRLKLSVGDAFPAYSLPDHDGFVSTVAAGAPRTPALYIFYRGDW